MRVLITGTSTGIGKAIALNFINHGHEVFGIDRELSTINNRNYTHYICDVRYKEEFPVLPFKFDIIINNAGTQNEDDININLKGALNITETYLSEEIKSVLFIGSASAHTGDEFPEYVASKSGLLAYTKNVARRIAKYKATCNSLDPGGVITDLNKCILDDEGLWNQVMSVTPLKRWATAEEIADWAYFLTIVNRCMTGQNLLADNGESLINNFVWKELDE